MKRVRIFLLMLCITILGLSFAACNGAQQPTLAPEPVALGVEPTLGTWADNVFTSNYLSIRFALPTDWQIFPVEEIILDTETPDGFWGVDMAAVNFTTGDSVMIHYRMVEGLHPSATLSGDELRELIAAKSDRPINFDARGTTEIGPYNWEPFTHGGASILFASFQGGFLRYIVISAASESVDDILAFFIGLDDPLPEPEAAPEGLNDDIHSSHSP